MWKIERLDLRVTPRLRQAFKTAHGLKMYIKIIVAKFATLILSAKFFRTAYNC